MRQVRVLFSAYRRDEFADPEGFLAQIGVVLEEYPEDVIVYVTHPRTGLQRRSKWPPSIAEVVEACDEEVARLAKIAKFQAMGEVKALPRPAHHLANLFVRSDNAMFPRMVDRAKTAPANVRYERGGIWVPLGWLDDDAGVERPKRFTADDLRRLYAAHDAAEVA